LQELIRPAGFFTQKCAYLKAMAAFMLERELAFEQSTDVWALRKELLAVKGVGRETADSILLYAFNKPIFVIDAYTRRVAERHLGLDGSVHYDILQKTFMDALPSDVTIYNEYHALIVALCKESCHKSGCSELCERLIIKG
jgi:endonuclease-3 related protein